MKELAIFEKSILSHISNIRKSFVFNIQSKLLLYVKTITGHCHLVMINLIGPLLDCTINQAVN